MNTEGFLRSIVGEDRVQPMNEYKKLIRNLREETYAKFNLQGNQNTLKKRTKSKKNNVSPKDESNQR